MLMGALRNSLGRRQDRKFDQYSGREQCEGRRQCPLAKGLWLGMQMDFFLETDTVLIIENCALFDICLSYGINSLASAKAHPYGKI